MKKRGDLARKFEFGELQLRKKRGDLDWSVCYV